MNKIYILSLFAVFGVFLGHQQSWAQDIAPQPCDPKFYEQMSSRAWMETEREIQQNQNLIFKPDTVFDYTCFDRFLGEAAWDGGNIFTHTTFFGPQIIPRGTDTGLEYALERVVFSGLANYRNSNFGYSWLGGRGEEMGLPEFDPLFILPPRDRTGAYTCDVMNRVWEKAKCMNFVHNEAFRFTDGYYPIETIEGLEGISEDIAGYDVYKDVRKWPLPLRCTSEGEIKKWETEIPIAENEPEKYPFQSPLAFVFIDVADKTIPGICGKEGIGTGVTVVLEDGPAHLDGVCTNPGCTYQAGGLETIGNCT